MFSRAAVDFCFCVFFVCAEQQLFAPMVVDAVTSLDEQLTDLSLVGIKKVQGGSVTDSFLVQGVAFKKTFSYAGFEQQPKYFQNPKILLLNVELELKVIQTPCLFFDLVDVAVTFDNVADFCFAYAEREGERRGAHQRPGPVPVHRRRGVEHHLRQAPEVRRLWCQHRALQAPDW
jgi:hypothetical protein